jgi:hypothetical protein
MELKPPRVSNVESRPESQSGTPAANPERPQQSETSAASSPETPLAGARLTLRRSGALTQEIFMLGSGPSVIGRFDPETGPVDIDLGPLPESVFVSRHHAEIWCDHSGQWFVKDLGSGNGTFVCTAGQRQFQKTNGDHAVNDGDDIALGNARFLFGIR